ncbi:Hsp20/alpha crystallin family protein [Zavarzinia compransoris]|uniref:Hsp20/alpha crystallin family protein n=1 Tax=Zavarzinia marina TaxID=2911065 RepID=UPI001F1FEFD3|nr:Hsp20/alpha crystallin family protein [Zavarzinia marina]MCF4167084.1 Hsp20/alpha crystallin family protein [Zavarzinia marina]
MKLRTLMTPGGRAPAAHNDNPFTALRQEIDRLFHDATTGLGLGDAMPHMDVVETDANITVTAELPGMEEKDVEVTLADNVLTIRGEKKVEREEKGETRHVVERTTGTFARTIEMPAGMDPAAVKATMDKGVLTVVMPKPATAAEPRKIEVTRVA